MNVTRFGVGTNIVIDVRTGVVGGARIGTDRTAVLFGHGDPDGSATPAIVEEAPSGAVADEKFGTDSELSLAVRDAFRNGASREHTYAVSVPRVASTPEEITGGTGTLSLGPIVQDPDAFTFEDSTDTDVTDTLTVEWRWDDPMPDAGTPEEGVVLIHPETGEIRFAETSTYTVTYEHYDWQPAIDAVDTHIDVGEFGVFGFCSLATSVATMASQKIADMLEEYRLVRGFIGGQPNTTTLDGNPAYNIADYSHALNNDSLSVIVPATSRTDRRTIIGQVTGLAGGSALSEPIYGREIVGTRDNNLNRLTQRLTATEERDLNQTRTIPIRDNGSSLTLEGNLSSSELGLPQADGTPSTDNEWVRDFRRVGIVHAIVGATHLYAERARREALPLTDPSRESVRRDMLLFLSDMADEGLIEGNANNLAGDTAFDILSRATQAQQDVAEQEQQAYDVTVGNEPQDTISISPNFIPIGIVKRAYGEVVVGPDRASSSLAPTPA